MGLSRKNPNLLHRLSDPAEAREYIENFKWREYGFDGGKPYSFISRGERFYTSCDTDKEAVACAIEMVLSFEIYRAMEEKMFVDFEI